MIVGRICLIIIIIYGSISLVWLQLTRTLNSECVQPVLRIDNGGLIQSHKRFGISSYPNKLNCYWLILAPIGYQILIQFDFLNIELDQSCQHDFVELETSVGMTKKICGNDDNLRVLSNRNKLIIRFHSDSSTSFEGFQLRYIFIETSRINQVIPLTKYGRSCTIDEWKCKLGSSCIPKNWLCDQVRDCRDNSDESSCVSFMKCHQSQLSCASSECISKERWCDGTSDCRDNSDESNCDVKNIVPDSNKPSLKNECSFQSIRPNYNSDDDDNSQIVGGQEAIPGSWPWMISLKYGGSHICGASLLSADWAITAAHCLSLDFNPDFWTASLGQHYLHNISGKRIKIEKFVIHPKFINGSNDSDVALIKFVKSIHFSQTIQTVCLPYGKTEPATGKRCVIIGWGYTKDTGKEGVLNQAIVPIINRTTCNKLYNASITDQMFCAGYESGSIDACYGDSGGPLVCYVDGKFILYGVTSWGDDCALPNKPGVYADVVDFLPWISRTINSQKSFTINTKEKSKESSTRSIDSILSISPTIK